MRLVIAVLTLVVANIAIPTIANAATITLSWATFSDADTEEFSSVVVSLRIDGTWVRYEPSYLNCGTDSNTRGVFEHECNDIELINGNLYTSAASTTTTVTVTAGGEETNTDSGCDLSEAEALQTWLNYFFLSWGIMIPIFFAAFGLGAIVRTIRGTR